MTVQGFLLGVRKDQQPLVLCDRHALLWRSQILIKRFTTDAESAGKRRILLAGGSPLLQPRNFGIGKRFLAATIVAIAMSAA